jgi:hypothetical protein
MSKDEMVSKVSDRIIDKMGTLISHNVITTIALESVEHLYKKKIPTFSFATFGDKVIFL